MDEKFEIVINRALLDMELLRTADSSLPRVVRQMQTCIPFVGLLNGTAVASCLVAPMEGYHDIVNFAVRAEVRGRGYGRVLLSYVMDYIKDNRGRYVDTGCGNADLRLYAMLQRAGFRVIGVWPDYLLGDSKVAEVENAIVNRDMVRLRADLQEKRLATTGYDASGRL